MPQSPSLDHGRLEVLVMCWVPPSQRFKTTPWLRAGMYAPRLRGLGIDLAATGTISDWALPWDRASAPVKAAALVVGGLKRLWQAAILPFRYDTAVILRNAFFFTGPPTYERILRRRAPFLVYELDDSMWAAPPELRPPAWTPRHAVESAKMADRVICGNSYLAEWAGQYCDDVVVIPTVPDTEIRPRVGPRPGGPCRVGWYGQPNGLIFLEPYLDAVAAAVEKSALEFHVLTGTQVDTGDWPPGVRPHLEMWDADTQGTALAAWDVGIMPLPDTEWTRGKCANKLLHYMAAGLATVASPTGMNAEVVIDGETGYLVSEPTEWTDALATLAADPELTARMGAAGRARFERHYSLDVMLPRYAAAVTPPRGVRRRRLPGRRHD
ncbi:MAG: glycosyltransferase family 4 protein [Acidimicrobiia bacterium]|nr:glycosyltransferase family 4 protein [Acidimicrobiia bacterium]